MHTFKKSFTKICLSVVFLMTQINAGFSAPVPPQLFAPQTFEDIYIPPMSLSQQKQSIDQMKTQSAQAPVDSPLHKFLKLWDRNSPGAAPINDPWMYEHSSDTQVEITAPVTQKVETPVASGGVYVFLDYSNITANLVPVGNYPGIANHPINPAGLHNFLLNGRPLAKGNISASFPSPDHPVWKVWEKELHYDVRVAKSGKEMFVDDSLHAQIYRLLLSQKTPATIIIGSGDGNKNNNYSSFPECALRAAELGWKVEVCSWKNRINSAYTNLANTYGNIKIRHLENGKFQILGN